MPPAAAEGRLTAPESPRPSLSRRVAALVPGVALATALALAGWGLQLVEERWLGHAVVEALVLALLLGVAVRTAWTPGARWEPGTRFAGKGLLEFAIVLLGASVDLQALLRAGEVLVLSVLAVVLVGLVGGYLLGRALGLNPRLAALVAVGNAICGNSAIAAVAPVIDADRDDVARSIAFTAVLGVVVVLGLPLLVPLLGFGEYEYGVLAGMTVYAVPQVLAATFPVGQLAGEVGTLVKLVRVLLLGPVVVFFTLRRGQIGTRRLETGRLIPWFVVGFLALGAARSVGMLPAEVAGPVREVSRALTVVAMAALGLGVDVREVGRAGGRTTAAVTGSLVLMILVGASLIILLGIG